MTERKLPSWIDEVGADVRSVGMFGFSDDVQVRTEGDDASPVISGTGIVFNSPSENMGGDGGFVEVIRSRSVDEPLALGGIKSMLNHDTNQPLGTQGRNMDVVKTSRGVNYDVRLRTTNDVHMRAHDNIKHRDVDGSSFVFIIGEDEWKETDGVLHRFVTGIQRIFSLDPVMFPAYPATRVSARSLDMAKQHSFEAMEHLEAYAANAKATVMELTEGELTPHLTSVGIVLAKGDSKEIPGKNKRDFCGKPLVQWTIEQALASELDHVVVSSDDDEILAIAERSGVVAVRRPSELCDGRHMLEAEQHAMDALAGHTKRPGALFRLQPTSPLRLPSDINAGLKLLEEWPAVVSVTKPNPHRYMLWTYLESGIVSPDNAAWNQPRQSYPDHWRAVHGAVICARYDYWQDGGYFHGGTFGYEMPPERSVDIDSWNDWEIAEMRFKLRAREERRLSVCV